MDAPHQCAAPARIVEWLVRLCGAIRRQASQVHKTAHENAVALHRFCLRTGPVNPN
jgi:hypothetical protein